MDLLHNPLADMGSGTYLAAYALCTIVAIIAIRLQISRADETRAMPASAIATDRDPSEVAYLRGGARELVRFTLFDLLRRGLLRESDGAPGKVSNKRGTLEAAGPGAVDPHPGNALEAAILAFYGKPHPAADLFASGLPAIAETFGSERYRPALERERMFAPAGLRASARRAAGIAAVVLTAIFCYRLGEALARGHHNVAFAIVEWLCSLAAVALSARTNRLSAYGTSYLQRLRTALLPMRSPAMLAGAGALPIFVAATGIGALAGTQYAALNRMFARGSASPSDGCGSGTSCSSGSSCGGGSGCGGGCGG